MSQAVRVKKSSSDVVLEKSLILRLSLEEHASLRRVAAYYIGSLNSVMRNLIMEREAQIWPNAADRPSVLELDREASRAKEEETARTKAWLQKKKNAFQRKEARVKLNLKKLEEGRRRLDERMKEEEKALQAMKEIRAERRARTALMVKEMRNDPKKVAERKLRERIEKALKKQAKELGRPLTEREKWELGKQIRVSVVTGDSKEKNK